MEAGRGSGVAWPAPPSAAGTAPVQGRWRWLGRVAFADTAMLQERLRQGVLAGEPETLLLLEHEPVITLGRSADVANVLADEPALARRGIALHRASRGGDVTYHGPGQLVGYPVVGLRGGVRAYVEAMAQAIADVLGEHGVDAAYRPTAPGLWVAGPRGDAKICAFGVNVHRRVVIHGFALNLDPDLAAFNLIVPCGIAGCAVTSVRAVTGHAPTPQSLAGRIAAALGERFGISFVPENPQAAFSMLCGSPSLDTFPDRNLRE